MRFTADEDAAIRELTLTHTYAQIAVALGRNRQSVRQRAIVLGAPTSRTRKRRKRKPTVGGDLAREIAAAKAEMAIAPLYRGGWP